MLPPTDPSQEAEKLSTDSSPQNTSASSSFEVTFPVFSISVVASMVNTHAQTIRTWEVKGLLTPHRTPGGTRRYSLQDVTRIRTIKLLSAEGINLEGIRRILDLRTQVSELHTQVLRAASLASRGRVTNPEPSPQHDSNLD